MTTATNRPETSVAEARPAYVAEQGDIDVSDLTDRVVESQPHEDVVEFLLEQYRGVLIELAQR